MQEMTGLEIIDAGLMPYAQALAFQTELCRKRQEDKIPNTVIITEHPPVITLGARKTENKLRASEKDIRSCNIELIQVGRGGGTTAHNPGQAVLYPVIKLKTLRLDVSDYVRSLESIGIDLLAALGLSSCRRRGLPGLWIGEKKIASIGVQLKKWVSFHGMAININNDLSIFDWIVPCGLDSVEMTSVLKETGRLSDMAAVKKKLADLCRTYWTPKNE